MLFLLGGLIVFVLSKRGSFALHSILNSKWVCLLTNIDLLVTKLFLVHRCFCVLSFITVFVVNKREVVLFGKDKGNAKGRPGCKIPTSGQSFQTVAGRWNRQRYD